MERQNSLIKTLRMALVVLLVMGTGSGWAQGSYRVDSSFAVQGWFAGPMYSYRLDLMSNTQGALFFGNLAGYNNDFLGMRTDGEGRNAVRVDYPFNVGGLETYLMSAALTEDNGVLFLGNSRSFVPVTHQFLYQVDADGKPKAGFGTDGKVAAAFNESKGWEYPEVVHINPHGNINTVGFTITGTGLGVGCYAMRLDPQGAVDLGYGNNGRFFYGVHSLGNGPKLAVFPRDGSTIMAGFDQDYEGSTLIKTQGDGTLDTGFGNAGVLRIPWGGKSLERTLLLDGAERILLSVYFNDTMRVMRILQNGILDVDFANNGIFEMPGVQAVHDQQLDGKGNVWSLVKLAAGYALVVLDGHGRPLQGTQPLVIDLQALVGDGKPMREATQFLITADQRLVLAGKNEQGALVATRLLVDPLLNAKAPAAYSFTVAPNPVNDYVRIAMPDVGHAIPMVLYHSNGQVVQRWEAVRDGELLFLDAGIKSGVYWLCLGDVCKVVVK